MRLATSRMTDILAEFIFMARDTLHSGLVAVSFSDAGFVLALMRKLDISPPTTYRTIFLYTYRMETGISRKLQRE